MHVNQWCVEMRTLLRAIHPGFGDYFDMVCESGRETSHQLRRACTGGRALCRGDGDKVISDAVEGVATYCQTHQCSSLRPILLQDVCFYLSLFKKSTLQEERKK